MFSERTSPAAIPPMDKRGSSNEKNQKNGRQTRPARNHAVGSRFCGLHRVGMLSPKCCQWCGVNPHCPHPKSSRTIILGGHHRDHFDSVPHHCLHYTEDRKR